jgi:hypothetical protein
LWIRVCRLTEDCEGVVYDTSPMTTCWRAGFEGNGQGQEIRMLIAATFDAAGLVPEA